jgi:hypothetical protein
VVEVHLVSSDPDEVDDTGANIFVENWINTNSNYIRVAVQQHHSKIKTISTVRNS